ncbi:hypothetical protein PR048_017942 [Dryococelus australis]|uniref:Uncharacterized protein n=1 Tax=Dryococelus australis TaxID=614101 RepID=A0ABQ9HAW9_9NEOP|nr:hypothetical protein PR048_017942 [Dryococelus australis]
MSADESNDGDVVDVTVSGSRKKRKYGSMFEASKKLRDTTYETDALIRHSNDLGNRNFENSFFVNAIKQRRLTQAEQNARLNEFLYAYKVHVNRENCLADNPVCFKGFFYPCLVSLIAAFKQLSLLLSQLEWYQLTNEENIKRGDEENYLMLHMRRWTSFLNHSRVAKPITV